jgi:hypothetical protein
VRHFPSYFVFVSVEIGHILQLPLYLGKKGFGRFIVGECFPEFHDSPHDTFPVEPERVQNFVFGTQMQWGFHCQRGRLFAQKVPNSVNGNGEILKSRG